MVYTLHFFFSSKCSLFHNSKAFGSCIIHILYTESAKIKKNNSSSKRLSDFYVCMSVIRPISPVSRCQLCLAYAYIQPLETGALLGMKIWCWDFFLGGGGERDILIRR